MDRNGHEVALLYEHLLPSSRRSHIFRLSGTVRLSHTFCLSRTVMNRNCLQKQSQSTTDRDCSVSDVALLTYGCLTRRGAADKRDSLHEL